ncbi:MAG: glycosyl hydrolase 53 family protein [Elusimicrobiota bacterium]
MLRKKRKNIIIAAILVFSCCSLFSEEPEGYYDSAKGKIENELRVSLHNIIKDHSVPDYSELWKYFEKTDATPEGKPWCMYSGYNFDSFESVQSGKTGEVGGFLTREHSWPKDWWGGGKDTPAHSDLFNVILADAHTNGQKGVKPLGEVGKSYQQYGISKVGKSREGLGFEGDVFEPSDEFKGDFARGYFYFVVRYMTGEDPLNCSKSEMVTENGGNFNDWAIKTLLKWHLSDPVSQKENDRNEAIFQIQGNRNPFIDHPEWASAIWGDSEREFKIGADANYSLDMSEQGINWKINGKTKNIFQILSENGFNWFRIRLWTNKNGHSGLDYSIKIAKEAVRAGLKPYLVVFLSDTWADYVKQPVPEKWKNLSFGEKIKEVKKYSENTATAFEQAGIKIDTYEIGNEIDFGICGEFAEDWGVRFNINWMKKNIWNNEAELIKAAQEGIKKVNPQAKFILHLTQWWNPEFCGNFYKTMRTAGVQIDELGLSYFPSSGLSPHNTFKDLEKFVELLVSEIKKPVIICEFAYPSSGKIEGQFAAWNKPVVGYPLTVDGQKRWISDFIDGCARNKNIAGIFYWSPEWYTEKMWTDFALFDKTGEAKPALKMFHVKQ